MRSGYKGERDEEIAIFEDLRRLRPGNGRHLGCLGRALQSRAARRKRRVPGGGRGGQSRGRPQEARRRLCAFQPRLRLVYPGKARFGDRRVPQGHRASSPTTPPSTTTSARPSVGRGSWTQAIAEHQKAIRIQPDFANAHNTLGHILESKQDYRAAAAEFRKAIELQPDFAVFHNNLGMALQQQGELDEAITEYRERQPAPA